MSSTKDTKNHKEKELIFGEECYEIIGAAIDVHRELGPGFLEAVYQAALKLELMRKAIPFAVEQKLDIYYKGQNLGLQYRADFVCYGEIIVELKALDRLSGKEESQIIHYLKATKKRAGLLINFGSSGVLEWKKFVH